MRAKKTASEKTTKPAACSLWPAALRRTSFGQRALPFAVAFASFSGGLSPVAAQKNATTAPAAPAPAAPVVAESQAFFKAVIQGRINEVSAMLKQSPDLVKARDDAGFSPLHRAVLTFNRNIVELLLAAGADPKVAAPDGTTPLHVAAEAADGDTVQLLLETGVDVNVRDGAGRTPLLRAVPASNLEAAATLLEKGASADAVSNLGDTPLHLALRQGNAALQVLLIERGAPLNRTDQFGLSPVLLAVVSGSRSALEAINNRLAVSKDGTGRKPDALTQAFVATARNEADRLATLLAASPHLSGAHLATGTSLLHVAALWGANDSINVLLRAGADPDIRDAQAQTPLHVVARGAALAADSAAALAADGAEAAPDTPAALGAAEAASRLLAHKATVNAVDVRGETPLHKAAAVNNTRLVQTLLAQGAAVNARDENGATPLHKASWARLKNNTQALLAKGANPDLRDNLGRPALVPARNNAR